MKETMVRVEDVAPIRHREAMARAETEYRRFTDMLQKLQPDDWSEATVCTDWNVKQLVAHVLGFGESNASIRVFVSGLRRGRKRAAEKGYDHFIHGMNEVQVAEREHLTPAELIDRWSEVWPKALKGRRRFPPFMRPVPVDFGPPIGKKPMGSYLNDVVFTRDTWMHRIDICRAVGLDPVLTPDHDGRLIENMVAEWARLYGIAFSLHLEGAAGGTYVSGNGGDDLSIDAVEWIWILSGRGTGTGLLEKGLSLMETTVTEIADGIYRLSTLTDAVPGGFTFNQFLVKGDEALLFHTGPQGLFGSVSEAVNTVVPVAALRWVSFGHWEADESGALNLWLEAAPHAELAVGSLGTMLSGNDQAMRPPRPLADGEVLDLGGRRLRWIDTPHVPHGWDAGLLWEEGSATLLCGDLFTQTGDTSITTGDILGPAVALEDMMSATALTPRTAPTIRRLADLRPSTLALMHGPSFSGDGASALLALAGDYEGRLEKEMAEFG